MNEQEFVEKFAMRAVKHLESAEETLQFLGHHTDDEGEMIMILAVAMNMVGHNIMQNNPFSKFKGKRFHA